jgi:hypothetical protein
LDIQVVKERARYLARICDIKYRDRQSVRLIHVNGSNSHRKRIDSANKVSLFSIVVKTTTVCWNHGAWSAHLVPQGKRLL